MAAPMDELDFTKLKAADPVDLINSLFGEDVQCLSNVKKLHKHYDSLHKETQKQVKLKH